MKLNEKFGELADEEAIRRAVSALKENGIEAVVVSSGEEAKQTLLGFIPEGAEVMTMTSVTIDTIGATKEINESGRYRPVRAKLADSAISKEEKMRLGAAHEYVVGSVHAVTEDGKVLIASATGSQLGSYAYGAGKVIWVVGAQKIVKNLDEGMKRLYEYCLPLEDERARKVYGVGSGVNNILIINKRVDPGRITMIIVKEKLGF